MTSRHPSVVVIGSGFGGLAAAIELKRRGFHDLLICERAEDVGGVWRENTYPGAACDVPSPLYSYSFAPNHRWPRRYAQQPDILAYLRDVADRYDLRKHARLGTEIASATYDDRTCRWRLTTTEGARIETDVVVSAVGLLSRPRLPHIPGLATFAGESFHTAQWRHDVDLAGKRVAVIGTGASAVQVVPAIAEETAHLTVFQRTPPWLLPRMDPEYSDRALRAFARVPLIHAADRLTWWLATEALAVGLLYRPALAAALRTWSLTHLRRQVPDPALRRRLTPDYPIGCKRILFSSDYLPTLTRDDVDLVTTGIGEITPQGVRTREGRLHEVDVIVCGTGFTATDFLSPMRVRGRGGADLAERWRDGAHAYLGMCVPDFPDFFIMYGPNTNLGSGSIVAMLEAQAGYVGQMVERIAETGRPATVRAEVERGFDEEIQRRLAGGVWAQCASWYRTDSGRIVTNWAGTVSEYRRRTRSLDPADLEP